MWCARPASEKDANAAKPSPVQVVQLEEISDPPSRTCYPLRRADSFTCSEPRSLHRHRKELVSGSLRTDGRSSSQDTNLDFTGRFAFHTWTRTGQDPNCITR